MTCYVLCGIPGSGKTTLSHKLSVEYNAKLYCYDDMPGANQPGTYTQTHVTMWKNVVHDLQEGVPVVVDDIHTTLAMRETALSALAGVDCKKTIIVMRTPYDVCVLRNASRVSHIPVSIIQSLHMRFQPPTFKEGWDNIVHHNE